MTTQRFFGLIEEGISNGLGLLDPAFTLRHAAYVRHLQDPCGGFPGRRGAADLYYTDFAVRILALSEPGDAEVTAAARFLATAGSPAHVVEVFNTLNLSRLLSSRGRTVVLDLPATVSALERYRLPRGGFCRSPGAGISAYATFLGALCLHMMGTEPPRDAAGALSALRGSDGGYRESAEAAASETNATAAAVAALVLCGAEAMLDRAATTAFLSGLQAADGGLRSHDRAPCSDLLSSFTGLVTLGLLQSFRAVNLAALARFAQAMQAEGGGFRSCTLDSEPDIEYTYYGLGTLGLLAMHANMPETKE